MRTPRTPRTHRWPSGLQPRRRNTAAERRGHPTDAGVTLVEVVVAFIVLMIAVLPATYLFGSSVIQAGQSTDQQAALSIAEQWVETLSNVTPPVDRNGEVFVGTKSAPIGDGAGSTTIPTALTNATASTLTTLTVASGGTTGFASSGSLNVVTSTGQQTVSYTGTTSNTFTGVSGWSTTTVTTAANAAVAQSTPTESKGGTTYAVLAEYDWTTLQGTGNGSQPNLCLAGTPQLLKLTVTVSWGPITDANDVQDSVVLNYPPSGIQTLGFIALQVNGDQTALDTQDNLWSERVTAPPVTITQTSGSPAQAQLTIYPDSNGCAFAQVEPGTYSVTINNATSGILAGHSSNTTYGSPPFVENAAGTVTNNELTQPQSVTNTATVVIGAVSRLTTSFDQGSVVNFAYPSSSSTEDGVSCPGLGVLTCLSTGETSTGTGVTGQGVLTVYNQATNQWTSATLPAGVTRLTSVACAGAATRCVAVGYGSGGAVVLSSLTTAASFTADTIPSGLSWLSQVTCPSTSTCVAVGGTNAGAGAILTGTIAAGSDSWASDAISPTAPTVGGLSNLTCPAGSGGCIATGTNTSTSPGTPLVVSGGYGLGWTASSPNPTSPSVTLTGITGLTCPSTATATTCVLTGTTSTATAPKVVLGTATAGLGVAAPAWTWAADTFPTSPTPTSLNGLVCPITGSAAKCLISGATSGGAPVILYGATTPATGVTLGADTVPAGVASVTQMACPNSSYCAFIGTTSAPAPAFAWATVAAAASPDTWTSASLPSPPVSGQTISQLTGITCWTNPACAITAIGTDASGTPLAFLLTGTGNTPTWGASPLPTGNPALYLGGVQCVQPGTGTCAAVGAGAGGAVELVATAGPTGSWSDETASSLTGLNTKGIPIEINSATLQPSAYQTFVTAGWTSLSTPLPPLYPFTSGYNVFAGDCSTEQQAGLNVAVATTVPGGSSSTTVPLGLVSVEVLHSSGNSVGLPYAATLSLQSTECTTDTYALQAASAADGLSRTEVPYGTYTLTIVTAGGTTTVSNVTVGGSTVSVGATSYLLPAPVVEKVT